jgi:RNA polymerase sigma-70 factor (ECF subfamily)
MAEKPAAGRSFGGQTRQGMAVTKDAASAWFIREIVPLEARLMHYLHHNWRNVSDIPDLRQEIYARVLQAARERIPDNPEHFLFVCARNHLIDLVRREQVVPIDTFGDLDVLGLASDALGPDRLIIKQDELRHLEEAIEKLPPRTREAIRLAYFEGLSHTEIAKRMGVSRPAASRFIAKGTLVLADILYTKPNERGAKQ